MIFSNDLYRKTFSHKIHPHKSQKEIDKIVLNISRITTVFTVFVAMWIAWNAPKFLSVLLWIGVGGIMSGATGPLVIGSMWKRSTKTGAISSFLVGVIGYAACWLVIGWQNPFGAAGACVIVASIVMVVVSLFTKPMPEETLNKIFAPTRK